MKYENWIKENLIPDLIKNGQFSVPWPDSNGLTKIADIHIRTLSIADSFMLSDCYQVEVQLINNENENQSAKFGIILKTCADWVSKSLRNMTVCFQNEILIYKELFDALDYSDYIPKYYYSHVKEPFQSVIALGDFTYDGYRMSQAKGKLSLEHIYEAVKLLGKFQGLAYALKHTNIEKFNEIKNKLQEGKFFKGLDYLPPFNKVVENGPKRIFETMKEHQLVESVPLDFAERLTEIIGYPLDYEWKMCTYQEEPYAILSHGDFLRNNIAFKYSEFSETPIQAIMFDFQTFRYGSPMIDLVTFMALSTAVDVRSKHFDYIFQSYHGELVKVYLQKMRLDKESLPEFLNYNSMLKEYGRFMPLGISIASYFLPMALANDGIDLQTGYTLPPDFVIDREFKRGGEYINYELRSLVGDLYKFYNEQQMDFLRI